MDRPKDFDAKRQRGSTARGLSSAGRAPALQAGGHRFDPDRLHQIRFDRQAHDVGLAVQPDEDFDIVQRDTTSVSPVSRVGEDLGFDPAGDIVPSLVQLTAWSKDLAWECTCF